MKEKKKTPALLAAGPREDLGFVAPAKIPQYFEKKSHLMLTNISHLIFTKAIGYC